MAYSQRSDEPYCYLCSDENNAVFHQHNSPKQIWIMQAVEYERDNLPVMCTSCLDVHPARPSEGLNICVGAGHIHNLHTPRTVHSTSRMEPDPIHIDWLTFSTAPVHIARKAFVKD